MTWACTPAVVCTRMISIIDINLNQVLIQATEIPALIHNDHIITSVDRIKKGIPQNSLSYLSTDWMVDSSRKELRMVKLNLYNHSGMSPENILFNCRSRFNKMSQNVFGASMIWEVIPAMSLDIPLCLMIKGKILAKSIPYPMICLNSNQLIFFIEFSPDYPCVPEFWSNSLCSWLLWHTRPAKPRVSTAKICQFWLQILVTGQFSKVANGSSPSASSGLVWADCSAVEEHFRERPSTS